MKIDKLTTDYIKRNHINALALERMIGCPKHSVLNFLGGKNKAKFIKNKWLPSAVGILSKYGLKLVPNQLGVSYPHDDEGALKITYLEPMTVAQLLEHKGVFFKLVHKSIPCDKWIENTDASQHMTLRAFLRDAPVKLDSLNKKYGFRDYYLYEFRDDRIQVDVNSITFQKFVVGLQEFGFKFFGGYSGQHQYDIVIKRKMTHISLLEEVNLNEPYDLNAQYLAVKEVIVPKLVYQQQDVNLFISQ